MEWVKVVLIAIGLIGLTTFVADTACENATGERCSFGWPITTHDKGE